MNVASLFATLGIKIAPETFAKANSALARLRNSAQKTVDSIRNGFGRLRGVLVGALGLGASIYGLGKLGDAYTGAASRIRQLTEDAAQQKRLQEALYASAQNTATAYEDQVKVFQEVGFAAKSNGRTLEAGVKITDTLAKAFKAGGASAQDQSNALRQLGQALGSGTLRSEEFNSVIDAAPNLIDLFAKQLNTTRGGMRKMAEQGKITTEVMLKALEAQAGAVDAAFAKRIPQVGDLFTRLGNNVKKALGEIAQNKEVMAALQTLITGVSDALVIVIKGFAAFAKWLTDNKKVVIIALAAISAVLLKFAYTAAAAWLAAAWPVLLVAAAIAAVSAAIAALIIYWDDVVDAVKVAVRWFLKWTPVGWQIRAIIWLIKKAVDGIRRAIDAVAESDAWKVIAAAAEAMGRVMVAVFGFVGEKVGWLIDRLGELKDRLVSTYEYLSSGDVFSDIGDFFTGAGPARAQPNPSNPARLARAAAAGATNNTTVGPTTINVTAPDAQAAANAINRALDARLREASAATVGSAAR